MKIIKKISLVVLALIVLLLVVPFFIPKQTYINFVTGLAKDQYQIDLKLSDASLTLFPFFKIKLNGVSAQVNGKADPLMKVSEMSVRLNYAPLLLHKAVLGIELIDGEVHYVEYGPNQTNLPTMASISTDSTSPSFSIIATATAADAPVATTPAQTSAWSAKITKAALKNTAVFYKPAGAPEQKYQFDHLVLNDVDLVPDVQADFELDMAAYVPQLPGLQLTMAGDYQIGLTPEHAVVIKGGKIGIGKAMVHIDGNAKGVAPYPFNMKISAKGVSIAEAVKAAHSDATKGMTLGGDLLADIDIKGDSVAPEGHFDISIPKLTALQPGKLALKGESFVLKGSFAKNGETSTLNNGILQIGPQVFKLKAGQAGSAMKGSVVFDDLNFDYLAKILPGMAGLPKIKGASGEMAYNDGAMNGKFNAKSVTMTDTSLEDLSADFKYVGQKMTLNSLTAKMWDGTIAGNASVDMAQVKPVYDFDFQAKSIEIGKSPSLKGLLTGKGDFKLSGKGAGFEDADLDKALKANGDIKLSAVKCDKFDALKKIASSSVWDTASKVPGLGFSGSSMNSLKGMNDQIKELASAFTIEDGIIHTPNLNLGGGGVKINLNGGVSFAQRLDYDGKIIFDKKTSLSIFKNPKLIAALGSKDGTFAIPLKVKGTSTSPSFEPDFGFVSSKLTDFAKNQLVGSVKNKLQDEIKKQIPKDLGKQLKNLF